MGIISDILERNRDNFFLLRSGGDIHEKIKKEGTPLIECPIIECPLCGSKATSDEDLKYHIREFHANQYVYLRANDVVVNDYTYIEEDLKSFDVVLLGHKNAQLKLKINDNAIKELNFSKKISLLPFLKGFDSAEINLKVIFQLGEREFLVNWGGLYKFDSSDIDGAAFRDLFSPLDSKKSPDFRNFSKRNLNTLIKKPEYRYASSLYEYALGFDMAARGDNKAKEHFEAAFSGLYPFKTNFALTARRVLSLRMNCFKFLEICDFPSRFATANLFFNDTEARFDLAKSYTVSKDPSEYGVYIDNFTELFIDALSAYYNSDIRMLENLCRKLSESLTENDVNNRDKLRLLAARTAKKKGDSGKARSLYEELLYHPFFKEEAREMVKGDS